MRTCVSPFCFAIVTFGALALGGCALSSEPTDSDASTRETATEGVLGTSEPRLGPPVFPAAPQTVLGVAPVAEFEPAPSTLGRPVDAEQHVPVSQPIQGKSPVPTVVGPAPELGPVANEPVWFGAVGKCGSDDDCAAPACHDGIAERFFCDAQGVCQAEIEPCGSYACGGSTCLTTCRTDADCAPGASCTDGRCK